MDIAITFNKSLQERLREYVTILGDCTLPVSEIMNAWSFYLDLTVDTSGWQAIWKISRVDCDALKIAFPTLVLVYVEDVNTTNLTATVEILAVRDDIHLPERHVVKLMYLYPTVEQAKSVVLDLVSTAKALDAFRFFFTNIIVPWDYDENKTSDWVNAHLEDRLRLFYDMNNGTIPRLVCKHIRSLFIESRRLQTKLEQLHMELDVDDFDDTTLHNEQLDKITEVHINMARFKTEVEIFENPLMRKVMIQKKMREVIPNWPTDESIVWVVTAGDTAENYIQFLEGIKTILPDKKLTFYDNLMNVLDCLKSSDIVILNNSKYSLESVGLIMTGGIIKGLSSPSPTEIMCDGENIGLDLSGDVLIENVMIYAGKCQCAILIRSGNVTLNNCKIFGSDQGILVLNDSRLILDNCEIYGFKTALVGNTGSNIHLNATHIHNVDFGIKMFDNCVLTADKTVLNNCQQYGFCVETTKLNDSHKVGSFELLEQIPHVNIIKIESGNNKKGDVRINSATNLKPLSNLFVKESQPENSELNGTGSDGDTMENGDITAIQIES